MTEEEAGHNITKLEIEMVHLDKDGNIKGVYHEEVDVKCRDNETITPDDIGDISDILGGLDGNNL